MVPSPAEAVPRIQRPYVRKRGRALQIKQLLAYLHARNGPPKAIDLKGPSGFRTRILAAGIVTPSGSLAGVPRSPGQDATSHRRAKSRWKAETHGQPSALLLTRGSPAARRGGLLPHPRDGRKSPLHGRPLFTDLRDAGGRNAWAGSREHRGVSQRGQQRLLQI
jgi:hypothetical protein